MDVLESISVMKPVPMSREQFSSLIESIGFRAGMSLSLLTWRDWDYFTELAKEDGGVNSDALSFWQSFPLGKNISTQEELHSWVQTCISFPVVSTKNGNHRIQYDLHLWIGPYQLAYNPEFEQFILDRHGILGQLTKPVIRTPWQQ